MNINAEVLKELKKGKNLLAFSYGSDSTALFYLLTRLDIAFDLAMINYKMRLNADTEELEAKKLALKFKKKIFSTQAPFFQNNFESNARAFRYDFFEQICVQKGYENLILAHQLNDQFEWFLMQFSKGAGLLELLGMKELEKRKSYTLLRPLLYTPKSEIYAFLKQNKIHFFEDESNADEKFKRNFFRKHFANEFLEHFSSGAKKSFEYLNEDLKALLDENLSEFEGILKCALNASIIAKAFKQKGILLSFKQRKQMMKKDCVMSGKIALCFYEGKAFVFEFLKNEKMPKKFKEECRKAKIPPFLRSFLFEKGLKIADFVQFARV
ncbi:tRNA lysidine(34) synthetase TilS [Campylobacter sp. MIT 99-7217]|uniref:tRNA lysidine(34) synthetase TilS n=1 Tax=Campylobacter sp. MIT 99-7217 TaxID=535091 RepID=UPI0011571F3F|nr:tRNA lysidine(34) synthetase TilS [Campylobacter sp. MIT 99-7217]TQR34730.1 tRNA lysidine(34) synthetase TilS [Campylobacter sp. MIT 99-7217]